MFSPDLLSDKLSQQTDIIHIFIKISSENFEIRKELKFTKLNKFVISFEKS